jgi:hypothetical protein
MAYLINTSPTISHTDLVKFKSILSFETGKYPVVKITTVLAQIMLEWTI